MVKKARKTKQTDIVVVGGGIVGMCLAFMLSCHLPKRKIVLLERKAYTENPMPPNSDSEDHLDARTTAISAGSLSLLKDLGLWAEIENDATPICHVQVSDSAQFGWTAFSNQQNGGDDLGVVVNNATLLSVLCAVIARKKNITVQTHALVEDITLRHRGAHLQVAQKATTFEINCSLVVVADGAESPLATKLGIDFDTHDYQQHAIIANVSHQHAHQGCAFERFTDTGPIAMLPAGGSTKAKCSSLVWTLNDDKYHDISTLSDRDFLDELSRCFGHRLGRLLNIGPRSHYPLQLRRAKEQVRSSLVLMGNAAHSLHPVAGQGLNLSLRDGLELSQTLSTLDDPAHFADLKQLQAYIAKREYDQRLTIEASHQLIQLFSNANPLKVAARSLALSAIHHIRPLRLAFFRQMMGKSTTGTLF